ncbi:hypothetical protein RRG08_029072 [Elysia crispata]|uniref:Uncharacterized protein n=1 Tax=Elysia crispata TaxID=231223 RepID=A0AAE0ZM34_9GAST|nr:hypothetical protein RRG08_029072 [Elysia crispata]
MRLETVTIDGEIKSSTPRTPSLWPGALVSKPWRTSRNKAGALIDPTVFVAARLNMLTLYMLTLYIIRDSALQLECKLPYS